MFSDEEGDVAADQVAVEARFVDVKRKPVAQIDAVANAAPRRGGQIAMQRHHPLQDLILMATNDALSKIDEATKAKLGKFASAIPGF